MDSDTEEKNQDAKRRLLKIGVCGKWYIECYKGFRPDYSDKDVSKIEFSAYAKTEDLEKSKIPNLSDAARSMRVDFDNTSVVIFLSNSLNNLVKKLQTAFSDICWKKENQ